MSTEGPITTALVLVLAAILLLWPAFWNGYPLVFADTGTYLSQAIEHYAGWDRPIFYSLFLFPLHMTVTTWPAIGGQALLVAYLLDLLRRTLLPGTSVWWLLPFAGALAFASPLPWFASQLMPDVFTGIVVVALALLIFAADRLSARERIWLVALTAIAIAVHLSHVPLAITLLAVLLPMRRSWAPVARCIAPVILAVVALVSVNLLAFGRASLAPFGNVFLLARVIYDGPGMDVLRRDCPAAGWRLCPFVESMPPHWDDFLWRSDGPVARAGGAKLVSSDASAIVAAALVAEPGTELLAFAGNSVQQLVRFSSGDGLQPWSDTVGPRVGRHFPQFENVAFATSYQNTGRLAVPRLLQLLHLATAVAGIAGCCAIPFLAPRRHLATGLAVAVVVALLANAAVTGGLSGPHERYQSRIMWLPPLAALLGIAALRRPTTPAFSP
jgi:hypothetical protein